MSKLMTLPDDLTQLNPKTITKAYGYMLFDERWLKGLPQFANDRGCMNISLETELEESRVQGRADS